MKLFYGDRAAREVSERIAKPCADTTAIQGIPANRRVDGMMAVDLTTYKTWTYEAGSSASASSSVLVPTDNPSTGRWVYVYVAFGGANAISPVAADTTALAAIAAGSRADGMICLVQSDVGGASSLWKFNATSTASDTTNSVVITPAVGSGRWLRMPGTCALTLPFTFATADAATIWTAPTGCKFKVRETWWEIAADMTGGVASAIGVHASPTGWTTKGDILGGAAGDVAATLVASGTRMVGTIGAKLDTFAHGRLIMIAADTFKFDQITSAFTAGSGNVRILGDLIANPGA